MNVITLNIQGINQVVKQWNKLNLKKNCKYISKMNNQSILNKATMPQKTNTELKSFQLFNWLIENKDKVIILTETKLHEKKTNFIFRDTLKKFGFSSWIHCNNTNTNSACQGIITILPKFLFTKVSHQIIEHGKVTETTATLKATNQVLKLISFYNPNVQEYPNLHAETITKYYQTDKLIIAGDFNKIINITRDYKNISNSPKTKTLENKRSQAGNFEKLLKTYKIFYDTSPDQYSHTTVCSKVITSFERIDWILYSKFFEECEKNFQTSTAPFSTDHKIVQQTFIVRKKNKNQTTKKSSKFFTYSVPDIYFNETKFLELLKDNLSKHQKIPNSPCEELEEKMEILINSAKEYKEIRIKKRKNKIENFQKSLNNPNQICNQMIKEANKHLWKEHNKKHWKNKSQFENNKGPNKIYTKYLKRKTRIKNNLTFLQDDNKNKYEGSKAANHAREIMQKIYQNEQIDQEIINKMEIGPPIEEKWKKKLNKEFSIKEIRKAIMSTPNKAPGPSGVKIIVFKKLIDIFAPILTKIANQALLNGNTSQFLLKGNITLIPKKEDSNNVNDLRPITLLEIPRKIITKAMTTRIKKCLINQNVISESQFCHPGRLIHENVHTLNLLVENSKEENKELHAVFLDCSKAFDRVNHNYLCEILERRGCGEKFINFIKTFLKGKCNIIFNNSKSDQLDIDRGVPQGETLSPFLFILAIDPLLNSINKDKNITGIKLIKDNVKVMAYADDLVLLARSKKDLERMLEHVRNYEKASNAKLNEKKSQILSFGKEENMIKNISEIEQCKKEEQVRHLGFFFNHQGLINNIDEIIEKIKKKLNILRNLFPNFTTRVNIWKGYAISSLLYQSEVIVITEQQIKNFEKIETWFLFNTIINKELEAEILSENKAKISLERLELPKKMGGMNLRRISLVFSASKAKVLMRAMLEENRNKPCYTLLYYKSNNFYKNQAKDAPIHFYHWVNQISTKINNNWEWFKQAHKIFNMVDKDTTFNPKIGDTLLDLYENKVIFFHSQEEINLYKPINKTIPIKINKDKIEKMIIKKRDYKKKKNLKICDQIITVSEIDNTPFKPTIEKAKINNWFYQTKVIFNELDQFKNKKINLKNIFKITIDKDPKPKWTEGQTNWMLDKHYNLPKLLTTNLKTISRIDDFRRKYLMRYWGRTVESKCPLYEKENFSMEHIFTSCKIVKQWEISIYNEEKRKIRIDAFMNHLDQNHLFSWIYNWCIWKNFWEITYKKIKNFDQLESQTENFKMHPKNFEFLHIYFTLETRDTVKF